MYNHAPPGYQCPLCNVARGGEDEDPWTKRSDVFFRDDAVTAWINQRWWGTIEGNVVIIPNDHFENIFELPVELAGRIHGVAQRIATAMMETYGCTGISTRQHNGPDGNQEVWHYHLHVFPRFDRHDLYGQPARLVSVEERRAYADRLREWFDNVG